MLDRLIAADRAPSLCPCGPVLARLEAKLDAILNRPSGQATFRTTGWLNGLAEIAAYCGRPVGTVKRYHRSMGLPYYRLGARSVSSPAMLDAWIMTVEQKRRLARKRRPTP